MSLFTKFRETIFLKESSDLERQIYDLKQLSGFDYNPAIIKDIRLLEYGLYGEKEIAYELKNATFGMYVLRDVTIVHEDLKAQIDYIIITIGYVYLVECKNLIGNIFVNSNGEFRREYEINRKKYREAMYSPYTQAVRHKQILKKRWVAYHNSIFTKIRENSFDHLWYKPLVVLANSKSILDMKYAPKEIKNHVVRVDQLLQYIKNDLDHYDKDLLSNQKNMLALGNQFLSVHTNCYHSIASKYEDTYRDVLVHKLRSFRRERSRRLQVPPYYIFNDLEMNQLITLRPKTMEELVELQILSVVKVKYHGKEILNILNK